jgi:hypothetical protein
MGRAVGRKVVWERSGVRAEERAEGKAFDEGEDDRRHRRQR